MIIGTIEKILSHNKAKYEILDYTILGSFAQVSDLLITHSQFGKFLLDIVFHPQARWWIVPLSIQEQSLKATQIKKRTQDLLTQSLSFIHEQWTSNSGQRKIRKTAWRYPFWEYKAEEIIKRLAFCLLIHAFCHFSCSFILIIPYLSIHYPMVYCT